MNIGIGIGIVPVYGPIDRLIDGATVHTSSGMVGMILGTADAGHMVDVSILALATLSRQTMELKIEAGDVSWALTFDSLSLALVLSADPPRRDETTSPFSFFFS